MGITKGTPEQFLAALRSKISELSDAGVDSEDIQSASSIDSEPAEFGSKRFIHSLIQEIESKIYDLVDGITWDQDDSNLYATVVTGDQIFDYTIPYSDLSFDWDHIEDDGTYVADTICEDIDSAE